MRRDKTCLDRFRLLQLKLGCMKEKAVNVDTLANAESGG